MRSLFSDGLLKEQTHMITTLILLFLFTLVIYFIFSRPYRKQTNTRALMIGSIKIGDTVYTNEGIKGVVQGVVKGEKFRIASVPDGMIFLIPFNNIKEAEGFEYKKVYQDYKKQRKERRKAWEKK